MAACAAPFQPMGAEGASRPAPRFISRLRTDAADAMPCAIARLERRRRMYAFASL